MAAKTHDQDSKIVGMLMTYIRMIELGFSTPYRYQAATSDKITKQKGIH
jgi:hypothetical protein